MFLLLDDQFYNYLFQISLEEGRQGGADCSTTWLGPGKLYHSLGTRQGGSGGHNHRCRSPRCFGVVDHHIGFGVVVARCFLHPQVIVQRGLDNHVIDCLYLFRY